LKSLLINPRRTQALKGRAANEAGYILVGVLILLFLFALAMAIAAPVIAKSIQRDKDEEAVQRGKQYKRAIRLFYKKFNTYPTSIAQLENTNNVRFLRKKYTDPITGKDDWRLIHVGEAKVPVLGFFGQPLQGSTSSVTTGLAGNGTGGIQNGSSTNSSGDSAGSGDGTTPAPPAGVLPGMSASGGITGATGTAGSTPGGFGGTSFGGTSGGSTGGFGTSIASQSSSIGDGTTGPIVGVGLAVDKKSIVIYHKQEGYKIWEFTYDPIEEQMYSGSGGIPGAQPIAGSNGTSNPGSTGFGPSTTGPSATSGGISTPNGGASSGGGSGSPAPVSGSPF
jgi:type II secretory pathway pseudopilin PulG